MSRLSLLALSLILLLTLTAPSLATPAGPTLPANSWQPLPGPSGGSVTALAISPAYASDHSAFAGVRGAGIYRTADGGLSWTATGAGAWAIVDLALSPAFVADQTLFALTGTLPTDYQVQRSTDGGNTWEAEITTTDGLSLAVSPDFDDDHTLYLLTGAGTPTYVSTDGGDTFNEAGGWFADHDVSALAFSPAYATDQTVFAAVPGTGLYRSTNAGVNWSATTLGGDVAAVAVSPDYAAQPMVLAILDNGQVQRSLDAGDSWDVLPPTLAVGDHFNIAFSPTFASDRLLLVASSADPGPYRSDDGGDTWSAVGWYDPDTLYQGFVGGHVQALVLVPPTNLGASALAGTDAALYRSSNQGEYWSQVDVPFARLAVRSLVAAPGQPELLLAGTSYFDHLRSDSGVLEEWNGNLQLSENGGTTWHDVSGALQRVHQVAFSPDFASDDTAFATSGTIGQHGFVDGAVYRSQDGGHNWEAVLSSFAYSGLALSPDYANDQTLWVAASTYQLPRGIYVSEDGGDSWQQLIDDLNVDQIVPSPNYRHDHTLFAAGGSGLHQSTNGGASWKQLRAQPVTALSISPAYGASRTLYVATQAPGTPGALYRSANGGSTWEEVNTGMAASNDGEPITVSALAFAVDGSVLAGIHYGNLPEAALVYRSTDGGDSWHVVASGLKAAAIFALETVPSGSMHFYAGVDSGLWQLPLPQGGPAEPGQWSSGGPRGGKAHTLAVSPAFAEDGLAFSGEWLSSMQSTESGMGIIKSSDSGQHWYRSDSGTERVAYSSAVHDYAFSPAFAADETLFAATWGGLFKSQDRGETWTWLSAAYNGPPGAYTTISVAPDFSSSGLVMAGSGNQLLRSDDGGATWRSDEAVSGAGAIAFSPAFAGDQTIFAAGVNLHRTVNAGADWQPVLASTVSSVVFSPAFATDRTVFAAGSSSFYHSSDGGDTWTSSTINVEAPAIYDLAISPTFGGSGTGADTLFAATTDGLFRSDNGGQSWQAVAAYAGTPIPSLAISPTWPTHRVLLVGTADGVDRYLEEESPRQPTQGFLPLSSHSLAWSEEANLLLAGTANHGVYGSQNQGGRWQAWGLQEGHTYYTFNNVAISPDYRNDQTLFSSNLSGTSIGGSVYRSTDGGATWTSVYSMDYIGDIEFSPAFATDNTVYASSGEQHVVRSPAGGVQDSWVTVGTWPADIERGAAQELELPPTYPDDGTLFAAGSDGFWRLPAGETAWEQALSGLGRNYYVDELEISPAYAEDQTLLALASWDSYAHYGIFRSTNGGDTWHQIGTGVPDVELYDLAFSPSFAADGIVYLTAGDGGLYRSRDRGESWALAATLPAAATSDLVALAPARVAVGTENGVWQYTNSTYELAVNGGFEADSGWTRPETTYPARYADAVAYGGRRALQTGIVNDSNTVAYSGAYQTLTIPTAVSTTLRFRYYPVSAESTQTALSTLLAPEPTAPVQGDLQYALIMSADGSTTLQPLLSQLSNAQQWQTLVVDLSAYAGQTIRLHFGTYNDGGGGRTALFVDDVSLLVSYPHRIYLPLINRH